jgi:hypothetical protein
VEQSTHDQEPAKNAIDDCHRDLRATTQTRPLRARFTRHNPKQFIAHGGPNGQWAFTA